MSKLYSSSRRCVLNSIVRKCVKEVRRLSVVPQSASTTDPSYCNRRSWRVEYNTAPLVLRMIGRGRGLLAIIDGGPPTSNSTQSLRNAFVDVHAARSLLLPSRPSSTSILRRCKAPTTSNSATHHTHTHSSHTTQAALTQQTQAAGPVLSAP